MSDIFISYSRKDSEQALSLAERLRNEGMSVWIDQHGIGGAEQWATEIAGAIRDCSYFLLLLSAASTASDNVLKELSLASEKSKRILPIDMIATTELPVHFEYALAGIQRLAYGNFDGVLHAIRTGTKRRLHERDLRKSIMILPFEDLSPGKDNSWFTDGMASELASSLGNISALRVIDWNTSKLFKERSIKTEDLARELDVRYFIEGQVRKFGEQIKITISLLDSETAHHVWQDSMKGTMDDVFDIQERVAENVVDGLKLHLKDDERRRLNDRGTESVEAYELFLRAYENSATMTQEGHKLSLKQSSDAIELDPNFALAFQRRSLASAWLYQNYNRDPELLEMAETDAKRALILRPEVAFAPLSFIYGLKGQMQKAEEVAREYVKQLPENAQSHHALALIYMETGRHELAIVQLEQAMELKPENLELAWSLVIACYRMKDEERMKKWSRRSMPYFERRLRLLPHDEGARIHLASMLHFAGENDRSLLALAPLHAATDLDPVTLYNLSSLYIALGEQQESIAYLDRAMKSGFADLKWLRTDPDLDPLRDLPEFKELLQKMEEKHANV